MNSKVFSFLLVFFLFHPALISAEKETPFSLFEPGTISRKRGEKWKHQVNQYLDRGRPEKAIKILSHALRTDAIHPYAMGMYSYLLLTFEQRRTEAKEMAQNCLNLYPRNPLCLHTLAWSHYRNHEYGKALRTFEEIPGGSEMSFDLHYHWAMTAWKAKDTKSATEHFAAARKMEPDSAKLHVSLGLFLESIGDYQRSLKAYHHALNHLKEEEGIRDFLLEKINELLPLYKKMPREESRASGKPEQQVNHSPSSREFSVTDEKNQPNPFLIPLKSNPLRLEEKDSLEALNQEGHYELAREICNAGIKPDCMAQLHTVINLEPTNSLAISANSDLSPAREMPDQTHKQRIQGLLTLAEKCFREGKLKWSLIIYRKILLTDAAHPLARKNLSYLYLHYDRPVTALSYLNPLLEDFPAYQEALILKGYALTKLRRFSEASEALKSAYSLKSGREFSAEYTRDLLDQIQDYEQPLSPRKSP